MLSISHFYKSYGKKQIFDNVNIELEEKKIYGIVGRNGAGKTTLFNCILGLERYQGNIKHSEYDVFKNVVGYVPTELFFFSRITGLEYIAYMLYAKRIKMPDKDIQQANIFNLPLSNYISTYSNGMKKMLALTAVLLQQNQWFILDEPFNGVDIENNFLLTKQIKKLKEENKTLIISSHILESLFHICDTIFLITNKQLVKYPKNKFKAIYDDFLKK